MSHASPPPPWWESDNRETRVALHHGHAADILRRLPARSVHAIITSPPYYRQRDFGLPPQTYGGDPRCAHSWEKGRGGPTCARCGAWRGQLGLEPTPDMYIAHLVEIFRHARRALHPAGTLWLNLGDSYDRKRLLGIPWRAALALQEDGWILRAEILWVKALSFCPAHSGSALPEDVDDRPVRAHETIFLLARQPRYFYDRDAVREPHADPAASTRFQGRAGVSRADYDARKWIERSDGIARPPMTMRERAYHPLGRPLRSCWAIPPQPFRDGPHLATFPEDLVTPMILAGTSAAGACPRCGTPWKRRSPEAWEPGCPHADPPTPCVVLDPFMGAGTVPLVAQRLGRSAIGIELSPSYLELARRRIEAEHAQIRLFSAPSTSAARLAALRTAPDDDEARDAGTEPAPVPRALPL
jgi:DNA modification methylase